MNDHSPDPGQSPGTPSEQRPDPPRTPVRNSSSRALILGAVHSGGMAELTRILLHARGGDQAAADTTIGELVRALPDTGWLAAYDLLHYADVPEGTRVGDLTPMQRGALSNALSRRDGLRTAGRTAD
ncbi:hypothetical protein [Streptacidiphilus cavernicola]|uniref:Uncharacterized protein n=1 Tax=Streptacidiphilus cavernicola TaxID=3342716 RepID=A0ABV6VX31_9ACTN